MVVLFNSGVARSFPVYVGGGGGGGVGAQVFLCSFAWFIIMWGHLWGGAIGTGWRVPPDPRSYTALIWQKEASDKSDISRKRAKCVCHLH